MIDEIQANSINTIHFQVDQDTVGNDHRQRNLGREARTQVRVTEQVKKLTITRNFFVHKKIQIPETVGYFK